MTLVQRTALSNPEEDQLFSRILVFFLCPVTLVRLSNSLLSFLQNVDILFVPNSYFARFSYFALFVFCINFDLAIDGALSLKRG